MAGELVRLAMNPRANRRKLGRGPMEIIEEAVHLLRLSGVGPLASYYVGSAPFVLAFLYFWAEMSRSPFAARDLPGSALALALLFLWMKFWQAIFVGQLRARISVEASDRWTFRRCLRVFVIQTAIQPSFVVMLPLACLPAGLPLGWVYAFYQNVNALADGEGHGVRKAFNRAWKQCLLWPSQNHIVLAILFGFSLYVLLNLATVCFALPHLLKMLLGVDSIYSKSPMSMLNTTFLAALFGLTYLCVDPIVKTVYLLRCFYGESLQSGEDLKAELRQFASFPSSAMAALMAAFLLCCAGSVNAADTNEVDVPAKVSAKVSTPAVSPPALDKAINQVIHEPKYTWRMPREKVVKDENAEDSVITRFLKKCADWIKDTLKAVFKKIGDFLDWLFRGRRVSTGGSLNGFNWSESIRALLIVVLIILLAVLGYFLFRIWQSRRRRPITVASESLPPPPDLTDENVGADQLPEDGWIKMGRELLGRGELRLALRAFYFASLAHLSTRGLISLARHKSNRDYGRELQRRGHALPAVVSLFDENVLVFDRSWYGLHEVDNDLVGRFLSNVERIKGEA